MTQVFSNINHEQGENYEKYCDLRTVGRTIAEKL